MDIPGYMRDQRVTIQLVSIKKNNIRLMDYTVYVMTIYFSGTLVLEIGGTDVETLYWAIKLAN